MAKRFSKCPSWWLRDKACLLGLLGGGSAGPSIAALKCVMAISTKIDFHTLKVKLSFSDLETLTGLSRPMVSRGLALIEAMNIARIDRTGYVNEYELIVDEKDKGWAKLPTERVNKQLPSLLNRGVVPLAALKIYLVLLALRNNDSNEVAIKHVNLREYTGIQKNQIRPALDILFSHGLIRITQSEYVDEKKPTSPIRAHNIYILLGLDSASA